MLNYPTEDYLEKLFTKINHVATYKNDDPVEYLWHLFNTENGIYKEKFEKFGLFKKHVKNAVSVFMESPNYKGIFSFSESLCVVYMISESRGLNLKTGLNEHEKLKFQDSIIKLKTLL